MTGSRDEVLAELTARVVATAPGGGRPWRRIAVDGPDGAGKTTLADELARRVSTQLAVVRVSIDDFHHPRAVRHARGSGSPEGFWFDAFDYERFDDFVLAPTNVHGSGAIRRRGHDLATDALLDERRELVPAGAVVLVDGVFLQRPELAGAWDLTIFLDVPFVETFARMAARDGCPADPDDPANTRYRDAQLRYFSECRPAENAQVVVDNSDLAHPRVIR